MSKVQFLQTELATIGRLQQLLRRVFVNGQTEGLEVKREEIPPPEDGLEPITRTTLTLPINPDGDRSDGSPTVVTLEKEGASRIVVKKVKGREDLPKKELPLTFRTALAKINKNVRVREEGIETLDPRELDEIDPSRRINVKGGID